jgi:hypothetical protein
MTKGCDSPPKTRNVLAPDHPSGHYALVGRELLRSWFGPREPLPPIDPAEVLARWPLGQVDASASLLISASGLAVDSAAFPAHGVLAHDVVAILEPSGRADHYRLFDGTGVAIGAVIARRQRGLPPRLVKDHMIQFVDDTGRPFILDWWPSKPATLFGGETSGLVRKGGTWDVLGRCSADDKGRWRLEDAPGRLVAYTEARSEELLLSPSGHPLARLGRAGFGLRWPWRHQRNGYSGARVIAFDRACDVPTRALALAAAMCEQVQSLEDLTVDIGGD